MQLSNTYSLKTRFLLSSLLFFLILIGIAGTWLYVEVQGMITDLGKNYAVERVKSARLQLSRVLDRESALARTLANSPVLIEWMLDEENQEKRRRAFEELGAYRESFSDSNSFVGILSSRRYYNWGTDGKLVSSEMNREVTTDQWFFQSIESGQAISFNLDYNVNVDVSRVWINCLVTHGGERLGLAGTGLEITETVSKIVASEGSGTSVMLIDTDGVILAHRDSSIMAKNAKVEEQAEKVSIYDVLDKSSDRHIIQRLMEGADAGKTVVSRLALEGTTGLTAMTSSSSLDAYVVASLDTSEFLSFRDFTPMFLLLGGTIILWLVLTTGFMQRLVLKPLTSLTDSAEKIADGHYDLSIPVKGSNEISVLSSAFNDMATKIRDYTQNLEQMVNDRTSRLRMANAELTTTNNRLTESIRYAGLIQKEIMPEEKLIAGLFPHYSLFFRQRDIVGGDMLYVRFLNPEEPQDGFFLSVIDCEGHGVSGALMTMMTNSMLEHIISTHAPDDPAGILTDIEKEISGALSSGNNQDSLQSGFDIGLCICFPREKRIICAGAGMPLYIREVSGDISTIKGRRKAIRNRHRKTPEAFHNHEIETSGRTFFLITDGFVDQSGGAGGRSYGTRRLKEFLSGFDGSKEAFIEEFDRYRGENAQRDDVLALAFSFENSVPTDEDAKSKKE